MHNQPSAAIARYTQKATLSRKAPLLEKLGTEIDEMSIETAICPSNLARSTARLIHCLIVTFDPEYCNHCARCPLGAPQPRVP